MGGVGDQREENEDDAGGQNGSRLGLELGHHILIEAPLGNGAGDDHARSGGDHQRGELGNQAVTDGDDGILLKYGGEVSPAHDHADDDAAHEVDKRNEQRHHRVALDDLGGAVHSAVEVGLLLDLAPAEAGRLLVDQSGGEIRVNGHLLAGHGVQREAGGHLGHALGALGDDDELHQHDDEEDHHADDDVAAGDEVAEVLNNLTGVAPGEDRPGARHVQTQSEQCRN